LYPTKLSKNYQIKDHAPLDFRKRS